jgi:hypothetical protein
VKRYGKYGRNFEMIWKICWKSKSNSDRYGKYGRKPR